jgi:hypothetical protein
MKNSKFDLLYFIIIVLSTISAQIYYPEPPEIIGTEEIVFDWTIDRCEDLDIPDAPARAFRDADGNVQLIASHYINRRMIGPDLNSVVKDCNVIMYSDLDSDLPNHNNYEWLHGFYTEDGSTIYSIIHNENIPCDDWSSCWYNTLTFATSIDTGRTYTQELSPDHFLAGIPYQYESGAPMGIFGGSSPVYNPDDSYYYMLLHLEAYELQDWGTGVIRTQTLSDPNSWRGWDGEGFNVVFVDPYNEIVDNVYDHILEPVSQDNIGKMSSSLTYNTYFEKFMVIGKDWATGGIAYSLSEDLINWSPRVGLFPGPVNNAGDLVTGWGPGGILYPEIIDPTDTTRNFENPGQEPYLYFTKWNEAGSSLDRDLIRVQVHFSQDSIAVTEFTVNSTGDGLDNNLGDGTGSTGNTIATGEPECTLRSVIMESNVRPNGLDYPLTINFDIPGTGVQTIELGSYLFEITEPMIIDGYTQPGTVQNTNNFEDGLNFELMIEIDASNSGSGPAMSIKADNCTVKGLILNGGPFGVDYEEVFSSTFGYCTVQGNIIGYDATGTVSAGGSLNFDDCHYNQIGGLNPEDRNLICGLGFENSQYNVVQGNYIGTDITGSTGVIGEGGGLLGLDGYSQFNQIGGTEPNAGNVFAGSNLNAAIGFHGEHVNNNYLCGNNIGVNAAGNQAIGAFNYGIRLSNYANNNYIGTVDCGNIIGTNSTGVCVVLFEWSAHDNYFVGNSVGTDITGTIDLNSQSGQGAILMNENAYHNIIGGTEDGEGNIIAFNGGKGIVLSNSAGVGNGILRNSIHSNGGMGIDLGQNSEQETNDQGDSDNGPNDLQNYPVITSAILENDTVFVHGSLNSLSFNSFRIEFFSNNECDAIGYGEGEIYLGHIDVITDENGNVDFENNFSLIVSAGQFITTTASDLNNNTSEFSQCVEITLPNDAPFADNIEVETDENIPVEITLSGSDPDGDEISYEIISLPIYGILPGDPPELIYTPDTNWYGTDSFTYKAFDGELYSEIATVSIIVNDVISSDGPSLDISVEDIFMTVYPGDTNPTESFYMYNTGNEELVWTLGMEFGSNIIYNLTWEGGSSNGNISGTIEPGDSTEISFSVRVNNLLDGENTTHIWINSNDPNLIEYLVIPVIITLETGEPNQPPVADNQEYILNQNEAIDLLLSAYDPDGDELTFEILSLPMNGSLPGDPPSLTYTPNLDWIGEDSFTYRVFDGELYSEIAMVTIIVNEVNDTPTIDLPDEMTQIEDDGIFIQMSYYTTNIEGSGLTLSVTGNVNLSIEITEYENVIIAPDENWFGSEVLTFSYNNDLDESIISDSVNIVITPVNDTPVIFFWGSFEFSEDAVLAVDFNVMSEGLIMDYDGDDLTLSVSGNTEITVGIDGLAVTFGATPDWNGTEILTFEVNDNQGRSVASDEVNVIVTPLNDSPIANSQEIATNEDVAVEITLSGTDIDGDLLTFTVVDAPTNGTYADGIYTPNNNYFGTDNFTYIANDGINDSEIATVMIVINPINDAPEMFSLLSPENETIINITNENNASDELIEFTWEEANDIDSEIVMYQFEMIGDIYYLNELEMLTIYSLTYSDLFNMLVDSEIDYAEITWFVTVFDGTEETVSSEFTLTIDATVVENTTTNIPTKYLLEDPYPNPFNPVTYISYQIPNNAHIQILVYSVTGKLIQELLNTKMNAGFYEIQWDANDQSSGLYFVVMRYENNIQIQKVMLLK